MNVAVIGGGITGLFCAHYLMRDGHEVSVIERRSTGSVTSIYNAGLLTPSLAPTPKIGLGRILSTYLGRDDPVHISPRQILGNPRFFRTALRKDLTGYEDKIARMGHESLELYKEFFTEVGSRPDLIEGVAAVYSDERDARMAQASLGGELLDEVSISRMGFRGFRGGVMFEEEWSVNPAKLYKSLWDAVITHGSAHLLVGDDIRLAAEKSGSQRALVYVDGKEIHSDTVLVTAGSWTRELCRSLGYDPQILPARGLAIVFDTSGEEIVTTPALLEDYGVGLAQHNKTTLRITGFFEMVGFRTDFSEARRKWLLDKFYRHVVKSDKAKIVEEGVGFRPCTPDQMPLIGLIPGYKNAYIASGNCRLGVTLAPASARLLVSMLNRTQQSQDHVYSSQLSWYDPNRFVFRSRRR